MGMARRTDTRDTRNERSRGRTRVQEKAADKSDKDDCTRRTGATNLLLLGLRSIRGGVSLLLRSRGGSGSVGRRGSLHEKLRELFAVINRSRNKKKANSAGPEPTKPQ
jgi:hypothetical protein